MSREMKDSKITNIGIIPANWKILKVKNCFSRKQSKALQENPIVLSLARDAVKIRDISTNEGQLANSYYEYNPVSINDLLLNPMDLYSGANCSISKVEGVISPAYINLSAKDNNNPVYFDFFFKTQYWGMCFWTFGKGVSFENRWTLNADTLMSYKIICPPIKDQNLISDFLNSKCSQIDALVADITKEIELLKEYRKSVIYEAVTKGLDPDVEMKDSGIEWIGKIPDKWKLTPLKYISNIGSGSTPNSKDYDNWDGDIAWITPADFKTEDIFIAHGKRNITQKGYHSCNTSLVPANTVIVSKRAPIGSIAIAKNKLCTNQGCLTCYINSNNNYKFIYYVLSIFPDVLNMLGNGTTFMELSTNSFLNFKMIIPPEVIQKDIVARLDEVVIDINTLIDDKKQQIDKLTEYKKSLIYEYVTGKKEVPAC